MNPAHSSRRYIPFPSQQPDLVRRLTHGQIQIPQEFLDRHQQAASAMNAAYDNASFIDEMDVETSAIHSVQGRRRRPSRIRLQSHVSRSSAISRTNNSDRSPIIVEEYGLLPSDLEFDEQSSMPLRFTLRNRRDSYSLWPTTRATVMDVSSPSPNRPIGSTSSATIGPAVRTVRGSTNSRFSSSSRNFSRL